MNTILFAIAVWALVGGVTYAIALTLSSIMDSCAPTVKWSAVVLAGPLVWLVALAAWWGARK